MHEFEDFKSKWENQNLGKHRQFDMSVFESKVSILKKGQNIAPIILGLTVLFLILFLFAQPAENFAQLKNGILFMSFSILLRALFELWSNSMLNKLDLKEKVTLFYQRLTKFSKTRKLIHFVITPAILIIYMLAFYSLLPVFKINLSNGMYKYVLGSSIVFFAVLIFFKLKSIPKELKVLKDLQVELEELDSLNE